jgi:diguanylate cyclase (GGDEF)-like protein
VTGSIYYINDVFGPLMSFFFALVITKKFANELMTKAVVANFALFLIALLNLNNYVFLQLVFAAITFVIALWSIVTAFQKNQADKGLALFIAAAIGFVLIELNSISVNITRAEYFETQLYFLPVLFSAQLFVITLFIFTSQIINLKTEYKRLATKDSLTELENRNSAYNLIENQVALAARNHSPCALLMVDIDHFKAVNDIHGHIQGDIAIRLVADELKKCTRNYDVCCRFGGEEFLIFLPNTELNRAHEVAERLRMKVTDLSKEKVFGPLTVSIGLCSYVFDLDIDANISNADKALYQSKGAGRNTVSVIEAS